MCVVSSAVHIRAIKKAKAVPPLRQKVEASTCDTFSHKMLIALLTAMFANSPVCMVTCSS